MSFVEEIYNLTKSFPPEEKYGLAAQLRRASVSIPSNISEGAAPQGKKEFRQFLYMALGSSVEMETQLELAKRLHFISDSDINSQFNTITEIRRMIQGMISHLKQAD